MEKFWKNKRVLVTGHTGFKGPWLCLMLSHMGAKVTGLALKPETQPNAFTLLKIPKHVHSVIGDVTDLEVVKKTLNKSQAEIIIHLASQSLVKESYKNPVDTYFTNVMGTVNILEAARLSKNLKACLIVTSDKCYENQNTKSPHRENDPLGGFDPYSSSKATQELVAASYRNSFFRNGIVATARSGNVLGGGDWAKDRLIPDLIKALKAKKSPHLHNPNSIRPWMHVLDPLYGYLKLCEKIYRSQKFAAPWNFGANPNQALSVSDLAQTFIDAWGSSKVTKWSKSKTKGPVETGRLIIDSEKSHQRLKWKPRLNHNEAIAWTVDWYKSHQRGEDMEKTSLKQIATYLDL